MKTIQLDISTIALHTNAAKQLIEFAGTETVFLFDAPMGSGKTTFIKSLSTYLGVKSAMSSPSYSIVNEYHTNSDLKIFHFDLYRLKNSEELFDLGFEEYISNKNYVFIEWPQLAMIYISSYVLVKIEVINNNRYLCAEIIN